MDTRLLLTLFCLTVVGACGGDDETMESMDSGGTVTEGSMSTATDSDWATTGTTTSGRPTTSSTTGTDTDTDADTDTDPDTDTGTGMLDPDACTCQSGEPCSESVCAPVEYDADMIDDGGDTTELEAALTCALEALRDQTTGTVTWTFVSGGGQFAYGGTVRIRDDGTAEQSESGFYDLCSFDEGTTVGPLLGASHFEACLAQAELSERFSCLEDSVLEAQMARCTAESETCE